MISYEQRYFNNAHRISDLPLAAGVTTLYDGQWLKIQDDGTATLHGGSSRVPAFLTISSKYGDVGANINRPITQDRAGRDNVTSTGCVTVLIGPYRLATDQYETGTYHAGGYLKVSTNSKLEAWVADTDKPEDIVGIVWAPPATAGAPMTFVHQ